MALIRIVVKDDLIGLFYVKINAVLLVALVTKMAICGQCGFIEFS